MDIEYRKLTKCDKCESYDISEATFNEIHGFQYKCNFCHYVCWGGRVKNRESNLKRPPCPSPLDLNIDACQMCLLPALRLGYSETLETHHVDDDPKNNEHMNLWIICTSCHKLIHHQRTYRYSHYMRANKDA